jgi:hypothetical protein
LKYQKTLGKNHSVLNDNNVLIYKNKGTFYVKAGDETISNIKVYDIQGKKAAELKNLNANLVPIKDLKAINQVLVFEISLQENKVITKKVVN